MNQRKAKALRKLAKTINDKPVSYKLTNRKVKSLIINGQERIIETFTLVLNPCFRKVYKELKRNGSCSTN